jgi:hydrogenase nickel incorporation protein HypA/HybF
MNEVALAMSLVELACAELPHFGAGARITDIRVRLGDKSGIVPETLLFSFTLAAEGTPIDGAILGIDDEPLEVRCQTCCALVAPRGPTAACPGCGSPLPAAADGQGLQLVALSVAGPAARIAAGH